MVTDGARRTRFSAWAWFVVHVVPLAVVASGLGQELIARHPVLALVLAVAYEAPVTVAGFFAELAPDVASRWQARLADWIYDFFGRRTGEHGGLRKACADAAVGTLVKLAGSVVGRRHAHLRDAWAADLHGDPTADAPPTTSRRLRLAAGFVAAAARCRLDDAIVLALQPVDKLLGSWHGSRLAIFTPITAAVGLILSRDGFYGLVTNAENLAVITSAPYLAIKALRRYRQIRVPKPPERKDAAASRKEE
jgi:hypothetical protein